MEIKNDDRVGISFRFNSVPRADTKEISRKRDKCIFQKNLKWYIDPGALYYLVINLDFLKKVPKLEKSVKIGQNMKSIRKS